LKLRPGANAVGKSGVLRTRSNVDESPSGRRLALAPVLTSLTALNRLET
jgi:hypothetical protein